ncbi:hypothetical protein [Actinomadura yumaensis]|uniref:Integral membrane protein n=1 Tax=Actinomadura yumaensis TaxID=111807 RepID=A0ABW2CE56_9ACTN
MADPSSLMSGELNVAGTYTLTSTSANATAHSPLGRRYTAFTGELLRTLNRYRAGMGEPPTLDALFRELDAACARGGMPRPQQRVINTAGDLSLLRPVVAADATTAPRTLAGAPPQPMAGVTPMARFPTDLNGVGLGEMCLSIAVFLAFSLVPGAVAMSLGSGWSIAAHISEGVFITFLVVLLLVPRETPPAGAGSQRAGGRHRERHHAHPLAAHHSRRDPRRPGRQRR